MAPNPDLVVSEFGAWNSVFDPGHVAIETTILGVDRTKCLSHIRVVLIDRLSRRNLAQQPRGSVTFPARRFVRCRPGLEVLMRIMTAHAAQAIVALEIAAGENQSGGLIAHKAGIFGGRLGGGGVTLATKGHDSRGGGQPGTSDCRLGKRGRDRRRMMASRAMAPLTADAVIAGLVNKEVRQ